MSAKIYACLLGEWVDISSGDTLLAGIPIHFQRYY